MKQAALNFFDRVYVINLKSRPDRRLEMVAQLAHIGLSFQWPHVELFEATKPVDAAGFPTLGAHGCFMSHLRVLRDAHRRGLKSVLILEDDLNFSRQFGPHFEAVQHQLQAQDWGMLYGSYQLYGEPPVVTGAPCTFIDPRLAVGTTAFVAVNGPWIEPLIRYLEAMLTRPAGDPAGGPMHVDGAYCWFRADHPQMSAWIATPALGYQRSSQTDIHPLRWYDRTQPLASLVAVLRKVRNRLRR